MAELRVKNTCAPYSLILLSCLSCVSWFLLPELARADSSAEQVRKALDQTISVDFTNLSFTNAIEWLRDKTKLNIIVDKTPMLNSDPSHLDQAPLKLKLNNVKVRTVLRQMLNEVPPSYETDSTGLVNRPTVMTFVIEDEIVVVTSEALAFRRQMQQRVNVDVDKRPLEEALKKLAQDTGVNIVLDPRQAAGGKAAITMRLNQVPLETAVRLLSESASLRSVRLSNVLYVTSKQAAEELRKEEEGPKANPWQQMMQMIGMPIIER